jgi:hypothetical protein
MARIRSIKPDFWTDDRLTECSLSARLLFIGTWNFADDDGNLDRSAKQIKARVFPVDNVDCEPLLQELITHGLLIEYTVSDKKYLHIRGFKKHQLINRPSKPTVPGYEESLNTHGALTESSVSTHAGLDRIGSEGSVENTQPEKSKRKTQPKSPIPEDFGLTPERQAYAEKHLPQVDPSALLEQFRSTSKAKGWKYVDWDSAWQTLVRNWAPNSGHWSSGQYPRQLNGKEAPRW